MNALRDQELCNQRLRNYIDNILLRVVEIYPEILEQRVDVKPVGPTPQQNKDEDDLADAALPSGSD